MQPNQISHHEIPAWIFMRIFINAQDSIPYREVAMQADDFAGKSIFSRLPCEARSRRRTPYDERYGLTSARASAMANATGFSSFSRSIT
jgi:hypothetical protein